MIDSINTTELEEILNLTPSSQNILLVGRHGIGKSEILTEYFEEKGMKVIPLFLGQMADPGDLIGLPYFNHDTGHTEYYPPYWFPLDDKPIVLFLDELNRARPELMQTVMDLALNRKLAGKKLPEGSQIIAAVNAGEEYQVEELDPALVSRFNVYFFNPQFTDWMNWANKNKLDSRVIRFLKENQLMLDGKESAGEDDVNNFFKTPDRRAWKKVSDVLTNVPQLEEKHIKLVAGIVGKDAAVSFIIHSKKTEKENFGIDSFWEKGKDVFNSIMIFSLNEFSDYVNKIFSTIIPFSGEEAEKKQHAELFEEFIEWVSNSGRNEELGYVTSVFSQNQYPEANECIKENCPKAIEIMRKYIEQNFAA